jgi:hypothetical protein
MRQKVILVLLTTIFATGFASPSSADQQQKVFGVMDDNPVMSLAAQAGFNMVKKTVWINPTNASWDDPKKSPLDEKYRKQIVGDMVSARNAGVSVILELYLVPKYGPPRGPSQMRGTCDVARDLADVFGDTEKYGNTLYGIEVGVEPNSYTFWRPQFNPDGTQASAAAYERWLAICYDKVKEKHPGLLVIGGSLSSRGEDDPYKEHSGTSPTLFLTKFCEVYKQSGRSRPVMDWFDMHSYPDPEDQDPTVQHPYPSTTITIADGDKLYQLLGCFSGTAQPKPPILWGEGGYNTQVPESMKKGRYTGDKPSSIRLIDETTQGRYIAMQIEMAARQCYSVGYINFHIVDDPDLAKNWQSGLVYAPKQEKRGTSTATTSYTLKQSWPPVRKALDAARSGALKCG